MTGRMARLCRLASFLPFALAEAGADPPASGGRPPANERAPADEVERSALSLLTKEGTPAASAALARAAREIARRAAGGRPRPLAAESVRRALSDAGAFEPESTAVLVVAPPGRAAEALTRTAHLGGATHVGVGVEMRGGEAWAVLLATVRRAEIEPLPRSVPPRSRAALRGTLLGLARAQVFVTTPSGRALEVPARRSGRRFEAWIEFPEPGRYRVEVLGEGPYGPTVAAVFDVACGSRAFPDDHAGQPDPPGDAAAEEAVLRAIDALRARHGLTPLRHDARLSELARRHSVAMRAAGLVAHNLPGGGTLVSRLQGSAVPFSRAWENVARGDGALDAHEATVGSPAHLANLLAPPAQAAGVGIARGELPGGQPVTYLTEVLVADGGEEGTSALSPEGRVKEAIAHRRASLGLRPLEPDARLDAMARDAARDMLRRADPSPGDLATRALGLGPAGGKGRESAATADAFVASSPALAAQSNNAADARFHRFGVGAVRGDTQRFGAGRYWIAVVYAE